MDDPLMRRAGLDYHEYAAVSRHASWEAFVRSAAPPAPCLFALTTHGTRRLDEVHWPAAAWLVFGSESSGLPPALRDALPPQQRVRLPMRPGQRSLNLSNAVAVTVFEAWRQHGYPGSL
jgi:tRNA (cytidine/uridine-2'-O-)-methyltransferase